MKPWMARQRIISFIDEVKPHIRLAKVKPAAEAANMKRVPSARERKPESGIATTSAIRYEVCTQEISSLEAARPAWISASEAETIWMSRNAMNIPKHIARNARRWRGLMRSAAAAREVSVVVAAAVADRGVRNTSRPSPCAEWLATVDASASRCARSPRQRC